MSSVELDWLTLPDLIFDEIMMIVGLDSPGSLCKCRQVCRTWNVKIISNIWGNTLKRNILTDRVGDMIATYPCYPPDVACGASLAYQGLLGPVKRLWLYCNSEEQDAELGRIPTDHLTSLVSLVTVGVTIIDPPGFDLVTALDSVRSEKLEITNQRLGAEETEAWVNILPENPYLYSILKSVRK